MKSQFPRFFILAAVAVASISCRRIGLNYQDVDLSSAAQASCGFVQNSNGARVSWKDRLPIQFYMDASVPEKYRAAIIAAAEDWNRTSGKNLISVSPNVISSNQWQVDGKNTIYWVSKTGVFSTSYLQAKSLLRWVDVTMADVDILVNDLDWDFYTTESTNSRELHLESLLVHEFGHSLGLIHQSSQKSVMYMSLGGSVVRNVPTASPDLEDLGCEYL